MSDQSFDSSSSAPPPGGASSQSGPGQSPAYAPTGGGDDKRILSAIAYFWIVGLILYFVQSDREVRFHSAQAVMLGIVAVVISIGFNILSRIPVLGLLFALASILVSLAFFALFVFCAIQAYQGKHFKLPVLGDQAEFWAAKPMGGATA